MESINAVSGGPNFANLRQNLGHHDSAIKILDSLCPLLRQQQLSSDGSKAGENLLEVFDW
jgi:hypothetical protein